MTPLDLAAFRTAWLDDGFDLAPAPIAARRLQAVVMPDVPEDETLETWCAAASAAGPEVAAYAYAFGGAGNASTLRADAGLVRNFLFRNGALYCTLLSADSRMILHEEQGSEFHLVIAPRGTPGLDALQQQATERWTELLRHPLTRDTERAFVARLLQKYAAPPAG